MDDDPDSGRVRRAAAAVLNGRAAERIVAADGGISNRSYFVDAGADRYVLRVRAPGTHALLGIAEEFAVLGVVAAAGIGPRPVAYDEASGALLVERIGRAAPWDAAAARRPAGIHRIAALLRQLHTLSAEIEAFAPERYAAAYVTALGGPDALAPGDRALAAELITLARAYGERFAGETLCHNDLVADNVIDGSGLHLIDFEYAALSSPILDLASLAVMNDYSDEQAGVLIYTYHQREAVPFSRSEFAKVTRLVRLLGYFWARAEQARRGDHAAFSRFLDIPRQ